jgi:hypothetical protein
MKRCARSTCLMGPNRRSASSPGCTAGSPRRERADLS